MPLLRATATKGVNAIEGVLDLALIQIALALVGFLGLASLRWGVEHDNVPSLTDVGIYGFVVFMIALVLGYVLALWGGARAARVPELWRGAAGLTVARINTAAVPLLAIVGSLILGGLIMAQFDAPSGMLLGFFGGMLLCVKTNTRFALMSWRATVPTGAARRRAGLLYRLGALGLAVAYVFVLAGGVIIDSMPRRWGRSPTPIALVFEPWTDGIVLHVVGALIATLALTFLAVVVLQAKKRLKCVRAAISLSCAADQSEPPVEAPARDPASESALEQA